MKKITLKARSARYHFEVAIGLISLIPVLMVTYVMIQEGGLKNFGALETILIAGMLFLLVIMGYVILYRYPASIMRLRQYLQRIVAGELPDKIKFEADEDDIVAIEGSINAIVGQLKDKISDVKDEKDRIEKELQQAQRLHAMGTIAAGIAHEINTPTQFISDNAKFISRAVTKLSRLVSSARKAVNEYDPSDTTHNVCNELRALYEQTDIDKLESELADAVSESQEGLQRISSIVKAMQEFLHMGGEDSLQSVDINRALENTLTISRNEWKYVADVEVHLDPDLPLVRCVWGDLNQVFLNLIVNAADAIEESTEKGLRGKGKITVSTRCRDGVVAVMIADTGPGIPEKVQGRIFEPFFTTKEIGKGTGQGLAIAHSLIVRKHKGTLSFDTAAGKGTTFTVELPIGDDGPVRSSDARG